MAGYGEADPLDGVPPTGTLRTARRPPAGNGMAMPAPSGGALSLTGALPTQSVISKMMMLEKLVMDISKDIPALTNAAAPFIAQMRDLGAAALADQSTGGIGATNPEAAAPPPGMTPPPGGAGAGSPGMMPPMPLNL